MTDEQKAYEILEIFGYSIVHDDVSIDDRTELGIDVHFSTECGFDSDRIEYASIPIDIWNDEPPFQKAKDFQRNILIEEKLQRIDILETKVMSLEIEIGRLHREILVLEND